MHVVDVIDCYKCVGKANNSSCSDPFVREEKDINEVKVIPCNRGACLKRLLKSSELLLYILYLHILYLYLYFTYIYFTYMHTLCTYTLLPIHILYLHVL